LILALAMTSSMGTSARGRCFTEWAKWSHGMYERTPEYKNASMTALPGATAFLAQGTKGLADFAANMTAFHTNCRKNDLVQTQTLLNPSVKYQQQFSGVDSEEVT
jgi:4-hydroxyphenylacetate 3-monooxygenase